MIIQHDPTARFEQVNKGGVCEIKQACSRALVVWANQQLVAGVAGKKIRVISYAISQWASTANNVLFVTATGPVQIYALISLPAANGQIISGENMHGWFETFEGDGLFATSAFAGVDVSLRYIEVVP
jgi:hypothetical protein